MTRNEIDSDTISRAVGCLLGQLCGDALGSLVEFQTPQEIRRRYPLGVREMHDGGTWNTIAGQPTDDSEMALAMGRSIVTAGTYDPLIAMTSYSAWLASAPFDVGATVMAGIQGRPNASSQANGALMRVSPLGIFGANRPLVQVGAWAAQDAALTHPSPICVQINNLFGRAIAYSISRRRTPTDVFDALKGWAAQLEVDGDVKQAIEMSATRPPADFVHQQGWVLIAFQNALFQLLHAGSLEDGVVNTISNGGDTDTNAAIAGTLLGAVHGEAAIPNRWRQSILNCRPMATRPGVARPRPKIYWPVDAVELANDLLNAGRP